MTDEKKIDTVWNRHPWLSAATVASFTLFCTWAYNEVQRLREARLHVSTLGYTAKGTTLVWPFPRFSLRDNRVGFYWVVMRNKGTNTVHNTRVTVDNLGDIKHAYTDTSATLKTFDGATIPNLSKFEGTSSLRFTVDLIPPDGTVYFAVVAFADDVKGPPKVNVVSDECVASVHINDSDLEPLKSNMLMIWPPEAREKVTDVKRWE